VALAALAAACLVASGCARDGDAPRESSSDVATGPLSVEGLAYAEHAGSELTRRIEAAQLLVVPRHLGVFQVAGLYEVVLTRVRIELFLDALRRVPAPSGSSGLATPLQLTPFHDRGKLVATSLYDVQGVAVRGGTPVSRFSAANARLDVGSGDVVLNDFRITHVPTARTVQARRALWRAQANEFRIAGDYLLTDGSALRKGRGLQVDLEFRSAHPELGPP
jgi:hypothetical protein